MGWPSVPTQFRESLNSLYHITWSLNHLSEFSILMAINSLEAEAIQNITAGVSETKVLNFLKWTLWRCLQYTLSVLLVSGATLVRPRDQLKPEELNTLETQKYVYQRLQCGQPRMVLKSPYWLWQCKGRHRTRKTLETWHTTTIEANNKSFPHPNGTS